MTGRAPMLKQSHGKLAQDAAKWWGKTGELRKSGLSAVYKMVNESLGSGKTLIIGATAEEIKTYSSSDREIIPHSFLPGREGTVCFQTEYILVPPETVDQTVFLYGPEFSTHLDFTLRELYRITKSNIILGISFGEKAFGQMTHFKTWEELEKTVVSWPFFEVRSHSIHTFTDALDGRIKELGVFYLQKLPPEEINQKIQSRQTQKKSESVEAGV